MFSLGRKLAPSVIFIDEIETVLKKRDTLHAHACSSSMQGVFLSEWDGLTIYPKKAQEASSGTPSATTKDEAASKPHGPVVVLGATNRPGDLDPAILRRMPVKVQTRMPDEKGRVEILKAHLKNEDWSLLNINLSAIARQTMGYSGSDLRELVRIANIQRAKEVTQLVRSQLSSKEKKASAEETSSTKIIKRPLNDLDFEFALIKAKATSKSQPLCK
jgi:SpoVK/Ycf46/Vps4 family AAA+-type ATPase